MKKPVEMNWEFKIINGDRLQINLNGGLNRELLMTHEGYKLNLEEMINEIEFFKTFTKTTVIGLEELALK